MSESFTSPDRAQSLDDESWQPDKEDGLLETDAEDVLDEGWSAPERDPLAGMDLSQCGQIAGEDLRGRLSRERPDDVGRYPEDLDEDGDPDDVDDEPEPAVGRLVARPDDDDETDMVGEEQDIFADDSGAAGGDLSAEELAVHVVGDSDAAGVTDHDDEWGPVYDEQR
ncbi:DUF5709 domain-containing protein [Georgenia sp.]